MARPCRPISAAGPDRPDVPATASRNKLAFIGGFLPARNATAAGTNQSQDAICREIAQVGGYDELHVYQENSRHLLRRGVLVLPANPPTQVFDKPSLSTTRQLYTAVYVANGEQLGSAPHVLRPQHDWVPIVCSVGTTHMAGQWMYLLMGLASGAVRAQDGFIFKSSAARRVFGEVWADWNQRFELGLPPPEATTVIVNGADTNTNQRNQADRAETRRQFHLHNSDVVYLAFSRLGPGTKGDQLALLARWKDVVARLPRAVLLLAGAAIDRTFIAELRNAARVAGVADRVVVIDNPFEISSRHHLMSAADVFVHLSTGVEEASPNVICEAMAYQLPILATDWAGIGELVDEGETGHLVATRALPVADPFVATQFGYEDIVQAIAAGQSVACDFADFVAKAVALGEDARRGDMAVAARRSAEARNLTQMAKQYVGFFRQVSRAAEHDWPTPSRFRPLVDIDGVLRAQASRPLTPKTRVRLGDPTKLPALLGGFQTEETTLLERLTDTLGQAGEMAIGDLARAVQLASEAGSGAEITVEQALRGLSRLLTRLLNHGVLAFCPEPRP
jgi:glycosyltransferase involved in cell wall biosynthesis